MQGSKLRYWLFFIATILLHLLFIRCDPNIPNDFSRGAWTDEGLYLFQIRHIFLYSTFEPFASDGFLKTPLYSLVGSMIVWTNNIEVIRLFFLTFYTLCLSWFLSNFNSKIYWVFLAISCQATFFFHGHLAMAEVLAFSFLLLALGSLYKKNYYLAILFVCFTIITKIQFIYYLPTLMYPAYLLVKENKLKLRPFLISLLPIAAFLLLFITYHKEYAYILESQSTGKFQEWGNLLFRIKVNLVNILADPFSLFLLISQFLGIFTIIIKRIKISNKIKITLILCWIFWLLECHKLILIYLPQRYLFLWFAMQIIICAIQLIILLNSLKPYIFIVSAIITYSLFLVAYLPERTYDLKEARNSLSDKLPQNCTLIGPWAPSLSWGNNWKTYPAWQNYFENRKYWKNKSSFLVHEVDHKDNNQLFSSKVGSIDIDSFSIGIWRIKVKTFNK